MSKETKIPAPPVKRPRTPAQIKAHQENWALFQITGAIGNLTQVRKLSELTVHEDDDIYHALQFLENARDSIKRRQCHRKLTK